jgi:carboxypeptidase family protein/TonB-dependent receptor-like protein
VVLNEPAVPRVLSVHFSFFEGVEVMRLRSIGVLVLGLILASFSPVSAQERFGGLTGTVTDPSGAPVPGATITATNHDSRKVRTVVTGPDGRFLLPDLDPGRYTVSAELSGFQKAEDQNLLILLGRTIDFSPKLELGALTEIVNITGATPQIDPKSTTVAHNVTAEEFDRLPKTRSFQGLALTSPGVNTGDIEGGFQVNGASGAENQFTVDGVSTNSLLYGSSRQNTVFEYLQEVQVKTGGIAAEYGGALGGVISAVTKSGGNTFAGEAHYYFSGNSISAGPVPRLVLSPNDDTTVFHVQDEKQKNNRSEVGGSIGGPIVKDHLFFFGSVSPQFVKRTNNYLFSSGTEPGSISLDQKNYQAFGKVTYAVGRVQANGSVLMTPTRSKGTLSAYNGIGPNIISSSLAGNAANIPRGFDQDQTNFSGNVDFWLSSKAYVTVRGGLFDDNFKDTGVSTTTAVIWNNPSIGVPGVPANLQLPSGTQNTPRVLITNKDETKVGYFQLDYNHSFDAGGAHQLKGGVGVRRSQNLVDSTYPGGYVLLDWGLTLASTATVPGGTGTYGYYEVNDRGTRGTVTANMPSLYVQDTWSVNNRLTLNLGVRTEKETVPSFRKDVKEIAFDFGYAKKIAPRLGATYDVLGDGRVKAFGSWGRYFDWVKYELARGSFGGDSWLVYYRSLDTLDVYSLNLNNKPGRDLWGGPRDRRVPNFDTIDPDLKPMYQDALNLGVDYQISTSTVVGVNYVHNNLNRAIEDVGSLDKSGNEVYFAANPGEGIATTMFVTGLTKPFTTPRPKRQYDGVDVTVSRRFSRNWFGSANVTISRLYGNYAGLANSDEITTPTTGVSSSTAQQQAGSIARPGTAAGRAWDLDELEFDSHGHLDVVGRLATDRPVVAKFYGSYLMPFGTQVGAFVYAGSGTPMTTQVNTTNQIPVFVEGRGDMGRTPFLSRTDLLVSHEISMQSRKLRFELNLINLFNQKTATHLFNSLNKGAGLARGDSAIDLSHTDLAKGYDYRALINASPSGAKAYDPRYGQPDLWQTGMQGQMSVKFIF